MHASANAYFRNAADDARMLRDHGFDAWPDAEELARYAFDLEEGVSALAQALGVEMEKDVRGRWQVCRPDGKAGDHGRP